MENKGIRRMAAGSGVRLWQVAAEIGMNDSAFSRKLRRELKPAEKERVLAAIEKLAREVEARG